MHLVDDHGRRHVMDAEFLVEADGGHLALIMESRSGPSSGRAARNPDYNQALTILLPAAPLVRDQEASIRGRAGAACDPRAIASGRPRSRSGSHGHSTDAGTKGNQ